MTRPWRHAYRDPAPAAPEQTHTLPDAAAGPVGGSVAVAVAGAGSGEHGPREHGQREVEPAHPRAAHPSAPAHTPRPAHTLTPAHTPTAAEADATQAHPSTGNLTWLTRADLPVPAPADDVGSQPSGRPRPGPPPGPVSLEWVGDCLLAAADGFTAVEGPAEVARCLPAEDDRLAVVLAGPAAAIVPELALRLRRLVEQGWTSVRLVGSWAGATDAGHCPGQELADRLGIEVVAPDGQVLAVPDGSLFVAADGHPTRRGLWWHLRPGQAPVAGATRFPQPRWEGELAAFAGAHTPDVVVDQVPAGLWVHRPGHVRLDDLAFAMPPERSMVLLVSRPGDVPVPAAAVLRLVAALPEEVRQHLVAAPYGEEPIAEARLGAVVSAAAGRKVRIRTGLGLQVNRRRRIVAVDVRGNPTWRPFVRELAWRPGGGAPEVMRWRNPVRGLPSVGPGQLALSRRWLVELIEAGLWIRPADRPLDVGLVRELPMDPRVCTVVVGAPGAGRVRPPWRAIARLLRALPYDARARLRLALPADAGERMLRAARRACRRELGGRAVYLLDGYGEIGVPRERQPVLRNPTYGGYEPDHYGHRRYRDGYPRGGTYEAHGNGYEAHGSGYEAHGSGYDRDSRLFAYANELDDVEVWGDGMDADRPAADHTPFRALEPSAAASTYEVGNDGDPPRRPAADGAAALPDPHTGTPAAAAGGDHVVRLMSGERGEVAVATHYVADRSALAWTAGEDADDPTRAGEHGFGPTR